MSNINTILKKIAKSEKVELAKHEVNLATIDDLKTDAIAYSKALDKYNQDFNSIQNQLKSLSVQYGKLADVYMAWFAFYNDTENKAKDLGINLPSDIVKLEKEAIKKMNDAKDLGNKIYKFLQ